MSRARVLEVGEPEVFGGWNDGTTDGLKKCSGDCESATRSDGRVETGVVDRRGDGGS